MLPNARKGHNAYPMHPVSDEQKLACFLRVFGIFKDMFESLYIAKSGYKTVWLLIAFIWRHLKNSL